MNNELTYIVQPQKLSWILSPDGFCLKTDEKTLDISARDIIGIQYKDLNNYNGYLITTKPGEAFPNIKINRFPAKVFLVIHMPNSENQRPFLKIQMEFENLYWNLSSIPVRDQIIIENQWFPLLDDNLIEVKELTKDNDLDEKSLLFKQYLNLAKHSSDYIKIIHDDVNDEINVDKNIIDDISDIQNLTQHGFTAKLYPYQIKGVSWLKSIANEELGCILADEMGLGKTLQIIALITIFKDKWNLPTLVIAPATLLENWRRELLKFSNKLNTIVHSTSHRSGFPSTLKIFDVVITSYDIAVRDQSMLNLIEWAFVILDEAQAIKNPDTNRAVAVKQFNRKVSIAVTGTPIENRLLDIWSIMDFSFKGLLGDRLTFEANIADTEENAKLLERVISPLMLRRKVTDVAQDLPEKIIIPQAIDIDEDEIMEYESLRLQIAEEYGKSASLVSLIKLRQFCAHPTLINKTEIKDPTLSSNKYRRLVEIIEEINGNEQKTIIFTSFTHMSDLLFDDLSKRFNISCYQIDGRTEVSNRQKIVDTFSSITGSSLLILNPKAAGTGLNITAANHVIHYNLEWNPAVEDQATARAYRRGQSLPVTVHRLYYSNTIEEIINERLERKRSIAELAIVGTEASYADTADIARALLITPFK